STGGRAVTPYSHWLAFPNNKLATANMRCPSGGAMTTAATRMPTADRRAQIRTVAARLFATSGFHGVTIEDIGAACGISGPAVYRHFPSKDALLADLLVSISEHLLEGGRREAAADGTATEALLRLVEFHLDFSLGHPDLIRVQDRDLANLGDQGR